jgi:O-acetylhomoserine (thiol)-lyase
VIPPYAKSSFAALVKSKYVHDLGPSLSPFNAWQILQGIETLDLRVARQSSTARLLAEHLAQHPAIARVHHPSLDDNPWRALAARYLPNGAPSVFSFDIAGAEDDSSFARVASVVDELQVFRLVANIGDARSMVAHPASMTHSHLSPAQRAAAGISLNTVRVSAGLEDPADLIADLDRVLAPLLEDALVGAR